MDKKDSMFNIQKLAKMLDGHQMVTVEDFKSAVSDFINAFAQHRAAFKELSTKNEEAINNTLKNLQAEFNGIRETVTRETGMTKEEMKSMMAKCMSDMKEMCDEMEARLPQDGKDGMDADEERIIQEVLAKIKLPEEKPEETPNEEVDKINQATNQIKKERVEGLEQAIMNSASNAVQAMPVTTMLVNGKRSKNLNFSGLTVNTSGDTTTVTSTGGGTGDVVGPASATDGVPALFDGTTGKLIKDSTPTGTGNPVMQTSPDLTTPDINVATADSLQAGTSSSGLLLKNNAGTTVASFGVGSASSTNIALVGATVVTGNISATNLSGTNTGDQTSVSGNAGTATALQTARAIYGNNFDGTAALTQVIASTYGGTGNGFTKISGPTTAERTKTMRDASDTVLELGGSYTPTGTWTSLTMVTPVLGTPTSGTLTNCTGLPVAGITPSTSTALGVGSIELGHASDTTLSRSAAGKLAVEGVDVLTVAGGTLTGSITLGENTGIALDPAGSADGKWSGITIAGTAGYAQTYGDLVYLAVADSRWEKADADASATAGPVMLGMVVVAGAADGNACTILLQGQIRADAAFPALTVGAPVYVGETAGAIQVAIPTGADNIIRVVGFALTADEIYFNPSQDHQVTVA